eukprot:11428-Amphidinium_carterae.1
MERHPLVAAPLNACEASWQVRRRILRYVLYILMDCPKYITQYLFASEKQEAGHMHVKHEEYDSLSAVRKSIGSGPGGSWVHSSLHLSLCQDDGRYVDQDEVVVALPDRIASHLVIKQDRLDHAGRGGQHR